MRLALAIMVAVFGMAASPPPPPAPAPASATLAATAPARLAGAWKCSAYGVGDTSTQVYSRQPDGSFSLAIASDVPSPESPAPLTETSFAYDSSRGLWTLNRGGGPSPLVAPGWTDERWIFTGTEGAGRRAHPIRIVYTDLGPSAFRREHQTQQRGVWSDDAEDVCKRVGAPPAPLATPNSRPAGGKRPDGDFANHLVGGTWTCETIQGSPGTHVYRRERDGSITLLTELHLPKGVYKISESYRFDSSKNVWIATTQGGAYTGTAPKWLGDKWTFDGMARAGARRVPVRMIYTDLAGRAFRRDFRSLRNGTWDTFTSETCKR